VAAGIVALIGAALIVMTLSYRDAVDAHQSVTVAHDRDRIAQRAEKYFWREREAMNEYLLTPRPSALREIRALRAQFDAAIRELMLFARSPAERRRAQEARAAHARFIRTFGVERPEGGLGAAIENRVVTSLKRYEPAVLGPLSGLGPIDNQAELARGATAKADTKRALTAGILAALLALGGGAVFSFYAVKLVRRIRAQNEQLVLFDRLKDDFVASVSHELRTPLTSIRGYVELLLEGDVGELNEEQERFLAVVDRNADRLLTVVGDLLFVSQVEAGVISLERKPFELTGLLQEAVEAARPAAESKGIELDLTAVDVAEVEADRGRIAQVLDNLLSNAIKFTPSGGNVRVRASATGHRATIEVADSGLGISAEDQARLFTRFFRTSAATAIQGTGLGLTIVKAIVESHGGKITVKSQVAVGTVFSVELPLALAEPIAV
jgi:signal transduction histidine kinase